MNTPEMPEVQNMDRGRTQQSVSQECLLIPLRWAQHVGCKDEKRAKELSRKYFAMELGFKMYKSKLTEFTDTLNCYREEDKGDVKEPKWISQPPDLENDEAFYKVGAKQPCYEHSFAEALTSRPADSVLEDSINSCNLCKIEIRQLIKIIEWQQGKRSQHPLRQMSKNVSIKDLKRYCLGNLESWKGLIIVQDKLVKQLTTMKGTCTLELPPSTEIEIDIEHPEKLKLYAVEYKLKLPVELTKIDSADEEKLLRISSRIVRDYKQDLEQARKTVNEMTKLRQQRQVQKLFIKWKGMRLIQHRLQDIINKNTREFSLVIEVSEEEKGFNDEEFVYKLGTEHGIECPEKWKSRSTVEDYNRINEDIKKEYVSLQEVVQQIIHSLNSQRKAREDLQHCLEKWKGLALMHRALRQRDEMMSQLEATLNTTIEEEYYVDNEQYILQYSGRHENEKEVLNKWPLGSIRNETELQRTLSDMETACNQLTTQNKHFAENISTMRKRMTMQVEKSNETTTEIENYRKELLEKLEQLQTAYRMTMQGEKSTETTTDIENYKTELLEKLEQLQTAYRIIIENHKREKQIMDNEMHAWAENDAHMINRLAAKDRECDKLKAEIEKLNSSFNGKNKHFNHNHTKLTQEITRANQELEAYRRRLNDKQQYINYLEGYKRTSEKRVQDLESEKETLLTRLSKIASAKLTKGNAAITDLSDKDRPMKIAERYSELYDNERINALEELLDNGATDDKGVAILLQIVTEAYEFCCEISQKYQDGMIQSATCLPVVSSVTSMGNIAPPTTQGPETKTFREPCASLVSDSAAVCDQSPKSNQSMELVKLTEEQKLTLDNLRREILPQLWHAAEKQYGGLLNSLLQRNFAKKEKIIDQQSETKTDKMEKEMGAGSARETDSCGVNQPGNLDTTNEEGKSMTLTKMEAGSMENSVVRHQHQSCFNEGNINEGNGNADNVEKLRLQEDMSPSINEQADVPYEVSNDGEWTHIDFPDSNQATGFSDQNIPINKQDVETNTDENVFEEEKKLQEIPFIKTKGFAYMCLNLCWLMRIKDPPLHMVYDIKPGSRMDTDTFKHYTQSGTYVSFLVWPALRLHKDGALLAKGVAQPIKKEEASKE